MKTALVALVVLLAGCGAPDDVAVAEQPAGTVVSSQWSVTVRGATWGCYGSMGLAITDGKTVSGDWSCHTDLRYGVAPHNYTGPVSGAANGAALTLSIADGPSMPSAHPATATMGQMTVADPFTGATRTTVAISGTIVVGGETAGILALGL